MNTVTVSWITMLGIALVVLFLGCLWFGLVAIARARRGAPWWLMLIGVVLLTSGPAAWVYGQHRIATAPPPPQVTPTSGMVYVGPDPGGMLAMTIGLALLPPGILIFAFGFAFHGIRTARLRARLSELEQVTAAMSEEGTRVRGREAITPEPASRSD